jgi:hypothetical protein
MSSAFFCPIAMRGCQDQLSADWSKSGNAMRVTSAKPAQKVTSQKNRAGELMTKKPGFRLSSE